MNNNIYSRISPLIFTNFLLAVIAGSMLWNIAGSSVESMAQAQSRELTDRLEQERYESEMERARERIMLEERLRKYMQRRLDSPRHIASLERTNQLLIRLTEDVEAGRMSQEEAERNYGEFISRLVSKEIADEGRGIMERDPEELLLERIREREGQHRFRLANEEELLEVLYDIEKNTRR